MAKPVEQFLRRQIVEAESHPDAGWRWQQGFASKLLDEPAVAREDDGEDGARVEFGGRQDAQLGEDGMGHLLRLIDEETGR